MRERLVFVILITLMIFATATVSALDGEIVAVSGKVEYNDGSGVWKLAKAGGVLRSGSIISTGFKSEATVKLGASILSIRPLTRMTLRQLVERDDVVDTEVYLDVGKVKAEVNPLNNKKNGFTVKTPVATASVRGTIYEVSDHEVRVLSGNVVCKTNKGVSYNLKPGAVLKVDKHSVKTIRNILSAGMGSISLSSLPSVETTSPIIEAIGGTVAKKPVVIPAASEETSLVITVQ